MLRTIYHNQEKSHPDSPKQPQKRIKSWKNLLIDQQNTGSDRIGSDGGANKKDRKTKTKKSAKISEGLRISSFHRQRTSFPLL